MSSTRGGRRAAYARPTARPTAVGPRVDEGRSLGCGHAGLASPRRIDYRESRDSKRTDGTHHPHARRRWRPLAERCSTEDNPEHPHDARLLIRGLAMQLSRNATRLRLVLATTAILSDSVERRWLTLLQRRRVRPRGRPTPAAGSRRKLRADAREALGCHRCSRGRAPTRSSSSSTEHRRNSFSRKGNEPPRLSDAVASRVGGLLCVSVWPGCVGPGVRPRGSAGPAPGGLWWLGVLWPAGPGTPRMSTRFNT